MASTCIYKTVTLQNGEKYVLPSGAEIVSATNPSLITSACANLDNLENLQCFTCVLGAAGADGNNGQLWEAKDSGSNNGAVFITGISKKTGLTTPDTLTTFASIVSSRAYQFDDPSGLIVSPGNITSTPALNTLRNDVLTILGGSGITDVSVKQTVDSDNILCVYVTIVTTETIAETLSFLMQSNAGGKQVYGYFKFYPTDGTYIKGLGVSNLCPLT
jgi:hypothetical protein